MLCQLMLENAPIWLDFNSLADSSGTRFLHSNVKESLPVTALYVLAIVMMIMIIVIDINWVKNKKATVTSEINIKIK